MVHALKTSRLEVKDIFLLLKIRQNIKTRQDTLSDWLIK